MAVRIPQGKFHRNAHSNYILVFYEMKVEFNE